jgi:hypothetical protein
MFVYKPFLCPSLFDLWSDPSNDTPKYVPNASFVNPFANLTLIFATSRVKIRPDLVTFRYPKDTVQ